ncbi:replication initiator protein [Microviridae sp.]|nr:replication initiator protein [Microviridae sp.]
MRCPNPIQIRINAKLSPLDGKHMLVPCNQCLNCRINRRDYWATRLLLESHSNTTASFWTLTFHDDGLNTLAHQGPRKLVRNFLAALRQAERRAMNPLRVRSFGVLEYGDDLQRPHIHICLWNTASTALVPTPFVEGMPRPILHSKQWPHGHVDVQNLNLNSARYCAKYCCKFEDPTDPTPTIFHALRPKLGLLGLRKYLEDLSRGPLRNEELQPIIRLDGKRWACPPALRDDFYAYGNSLGLKLPVNNISTRYLDAIATRHAESGKPWHIANQEYRKTQTQERLFMATQDRKAKRLHGTMQSALLRASFAES